MADILGLKFPGSAEVSDAAFVLGQVSRESPLRSQIEVSPGSIRFRRTVPVDGEDMPGGEQKGSGRQAITGWTAKSRRQMLRSFAALDYAPMFADGGISAQVTLTYPGDWLTVAPSRQAVQRHFRMLERRFVRAWAQPLICLWKLEYQEREAPHFHLLMRRPNGAASQVRKGFYDDALRRWEELGRNELARIEAAGGVLEPGQDRPKVARQISRRYERQPRYRPAVGDGLQFQQWLLLTWADIVNHPDPGERERHERVGTRVDVKEALRGKDPKRASVYFSKHGAVKGEKEYQNKPPTAWLEAGTGPGRYWGYLGLSPLVAVVQVDGGKDYQLAKRTMRRWSARTRWWDEAKHGYVWVGAGKSARVTRRDKQTGKLAEVKVWGPRHRLGGVSGTLCVNDGPAMAQQLARLIAMTVDQDKRSRAVPGGGISGQSVADEPFWCERCGGTHPFREHARCRGQVRVK